MSDLFEDEMITITAKRHEELLKSEEILFALEAGGVDNREWYGVSLKEAGIYDDDD